MRIAIAAAATCLSIIGVTATAQVHAAIREHTEIPAEPLDLALRTLAKDRGFQLVYLSENVEPLQTRGAVGEFTVDEALKKLLSDSGLQFKFVDDNTVSIFPAVHPSSSLEGRDQARASARNEDSPGSSPKSSAEDRFRLAQVDQGKNAGTSTVVATTSNSRESSGEPGRITEIVVTAQKKSERLQDVPVPVTVLNAQTLADNDQDRLQNYFATVPGLSLTSAGNGSQSLAIRGITTGTLTNPTVGVAIDDVPYGPSNVLAFGGILYPDIDPSDLARIEVLRGPQGTLYGADSLGGLVKFVTQDPSTDGFSGRIQVLGDDVDHGDLGYGVRGAINIPISDTFAFRASGFTRRDAGYIENVTTGQQDINRVDVHGGRVSALWRPSDAVSLKLSALLQNTDADGSSVVSTNSTLQPMLGELQQTGIRGNGTYKTEVRLYTATLSAKLASLDLTSISGYGINKWSEVADISAFFGQCALNGCGIPGFAGFGVSGSTEPSFFETKKFTQELRLSSPTGQTLEWIAGAFYTHEDSADSYQIAVANNPTSGLPAGLLGTFSYSPNTVSEYALFGDLTIHFTDQFDVQFGGRRSENRQAFGETNSGPIFGPTPSISPTEHIKGNAFTYLVTPRFKISPDLMVYARVATGYRLGGPNQNALQHQIPFSYDPDRTNNYELGIKADLLDHVLTFDASAYYIDWQRVQLQTSVCSSGAGCQLYTGNGGSAKSEGLELSVQARPVQGLLISAVASTGRAELTQDLPPAGGTYGLAGDRLPFSSRFSGSLTVDQDVVHIRDATGFVGGSLSYVGLREGPFEGNAATQRLRFPGYTVINLHTGSRYESWLFNLFVNNVGGKRGIIGGGPDYSLGTTGYTATFIQPRTVGLSVAKTFGH